MWTPILLVSLMLGSSLGIAIQSPNFDNEHEKLFLITITEDLVEGKFYSRDLGGIHFISQDGGVSITKLGDDGTEEPLFIASRPGGPNTASIASILGKQFLLLNSSTDGLVDYGIPPEMTNRAKSAASSPNPRKLERLLPKLNPDTSADRENSFEQLLARPEIQLIEAAAVAMGNEGITGIQYPAALSFYMTALHIAGQSPGSEIELQPARSKRFVWPWESTESCHHGYSCPVGECPINLPSINPCFGMCGPQCTCWWWVCGDCCWHLGCHDHDFICYVYGLSSWECRLAALDVRSNC